MNIPKEQCEKMLDAEAQRVAKSILQLINATHFKKSDLDEDVPDEVIHTLNTVLYSLKEKWTNEINEKFIK